MWVCKRFWNSSHKVRGKGIPFPGSSGLEALFVMFVVDSQLNECQVVRSCAARGRCDVIWSFNRLKVINSFVSRDALVFGLSFFHVEVATEGFLRWR